MFGKHRSADRGHVTAKDKEEPKIQMVEDATDLALDSETHTHADLGSDFGDRPSALARAAGIPETPRRSELPGSLPRRTAEPRPSAEADGRKLHVGREISLTGEIKACERLVVEGTVEASLTNSRVLEITATGVFKGSAEVDTAEVSGRFEGDLSVRDRLYVRCGGRVSGNIQYAEIQIERGGIIAGTVDVLSRKRALAGAPAMPTDLDERKRDDDYVDTFTDPAFEREVG
jgi:cytoskeletal protein CcmA (bactofilin family)